MDFGENRNVQNYHLYENERKLLAGSPYDDDLDQRTKNNSRRNIIDTRLPNLPKRIQTLIDDVVLLKNGGFLDSEHWSGGWDELLEIQPRMLFERESEFVEPHIWMPNTQFDEEIKLGYTIGRMLYSLSLRTSDVDYNGLGWGFVLGVFGEPRSEFKKEYRKTSQFEAYVNEKIDQKKKYASEIPEIMEIDSIEGDLSYYPSLTSIRSFAEREIKARNARAEYKHATKSDADLGYLGLLNDILDLSSEEIEQISELASQVQRSVSLINNSKSGSLPARDVFHEAWQSENRPVKRDDIAKSCNTSGKQVTEIMNNLGSDPTSEKWENEPPLVHEETGRVNPDWSLTDLGYLVGFCMYENNGAKLAYRAIAQVMTDQQSQHELHKTILGAMSEL